MNFLTPEISITPVNPLDYDADDYDENPPNYADMLEQVMFEQGVLPDPSKEVSIRMPDIETIRPDIRQYNLLYLTIKFSINKQTKS